MAYQMPEYGGPTAEQITAGLAADPHAPPNMNQLLGLKYYNIGKETEGKFQESMANAFKTGEEGTQVAPNAASLRELQAAQGFEARGRGQYELESAATEAATRYKTPDELRWQHMMLQRAGLVPPDVLGAGAPAAPAAGAPAGSTVAEAPATPAVPLAPAPPRWSTFDTPAPNPYAPPAPIAPASVAPPTDLSVNAPVNKAARAAASTLAAPMSPLLRSAKPATSLLDPDLLTSIGHRKGTADVGSGRGGKGGGGKAAGLEAILPMLMAAMRGAPAGPQAPPAGATPMRKGTANVQGKGGKGGGSKAAKGGKGAPKGGGGAPPAGLEQILPALMAAAQGGGGQPGAGPDAGAAGPQAANAMPQPMAPGGAAPPGFARGAVNIRRYADGTSDVSIGDVGAPPGFAMGTPSVPPNPGYPFGAGYLFGATTVPGQGSGTVDQVPAMLAPHEAVLNKAAADMMGRGRIAALNAAGTRQMGMRRGAP